VSLRWSNRKRGVCVCVPQIRTPAVHLQVKQSEVEDTAAHFPLFFLDNYFRFSSQWYRRGVSLVLVPPPVQGKSQPLRALWFSLSRYRRNRLSLLQIPPTGGQDTRNQQGPSSPGENAETTPN